MKIENGVLDDLARRIHENYLSRQAVAGQSAASPASAAALEPWSRLNDDLREANRAQARDIVTKLDRIGCMVRPGPDPAGFTFTTEEVELLARAEHQRWARQRRSAGWVHGSQRDDENRHHPDLVPWRQLSEAARDKDRAAIRSLPALLATAGLHVERRS